MLGKTNDTENAKSVISSDMKIKGKISADGDLVLLGSKKYNSYENPRHFII